MRLEDETTFPVAPAQPVMCVFNTVFLLYACLEKHHDKSNHLKRFCQNKMGTTFTFLNIRILNIKQK